LDLIDITSSVAIRRGGRHVTLAIATGNLWRSRKIRVGGAQNPPLSRDFGW